MGSILKEYPDMTSAQVHDWLQERLDVTAVAENTVRNYVKELRDKYHIPKETAGRVYGSVEGITDEKTDASRFWRNLCIYGVRAKKEALCSWVYLSPFKIQICRVVRSPSSYI